jgi:membrane protease YdiL (CAAX protease family)
VNPVSRRAAYALSVGLLMAVNLAGVWLPGWTYVPLNLLAGGTLLWLAFRSGADAADLGLDRSRMRRGAAIGGLIAAGVAVVVAAAAAVPAARGWFDDTRAADIGWTGLLYQVLVRIPLGTALFEEVAFRGVLVGLGRRIWGDRSATGLAALLFGLWHVAPATAFAEANATASEAPIGGIVSLAVISTAAAGWALTWIRDRAGSLAAPALTHIATNVFAFTAAWMVLRTG